MQIAIVIYEGFTSLDATGPFEVLCRLPDADVQFVSVSGGEVVADQPRFVLPSIPLSEVTQPDLVVVAGGSTTQEYLGDDQLLTWLREVHEQTTFTTSVCTGSMLLGAAGLLRGIPATTHWYELASLAEFGAIPTAERVVINDRVITSAGVSSGIDMALTICARLEGDVYAQAVQLAIEYDPQPPHHSGSLAVAPDEVIEMVSGIFREHYGPTWAERQATQT